MYTETPPKKKRKITSEEDTVKQSILQAAKKEDATKKAILQAAKKTHDDKEVIMEFVLVLDAFFIHVSTCSKLCYLTQYL